MWLISNFVRVEADYGSHHIIVGLHSTCADYYTILQVFRDLQMGKSESTCVVCAQALIDPVALNCGHSFCQLCLANMWSNKGRPHPLQLKCPACQQPWKILPAINIQLR